MVLDLTMPEVDGVEFLKRRPAEGCEVPVVMSAGFHRGTLPEEIPVDAFIEKPFAIDTFLDTVGAHTPDGDGGAPQRQMRRN